MKKILIILLLSFVLSGCSVFGRQIFPKVSAPVEVINSTSYPVMPNISYPPPLNLQNPQYDVPRDQDADMVVTRITKCVSVPKDERDNKFWAECGEQPIIGNSNIYRGFDYNNWILYLENMTRIKQQIGLYNERIDQINLLREQWRNLNKQERLRVQQAKDAINKKK